VLEPVFDASRESSRRVMMQVAIPSGNRGMIIGKIAVGPEHHNALIIQGRRIRTPAVCELYPHDDSSLGGSAESR
jgi:hypothetical protein